MSNQTATQITAKAREDFDQMVAWSVKHGTDSVAKFKTEVAESEDMYHTLQWNAGGAAKAAVLLRLWATVQYQVENPPHAGVGPVEVLQHNIREVERQLLANYVVEQSTNQVHNALSQDKAEAFARFHEEASSLLESITKAE